MDLKAIAAAAALAVTAGVGLGVGQRPGEAASYACRRCGTVLFREDEIVETRPLWDLGEERNLVHVLRSASGLQHLRRYDASLHQGWYCCRFALMRMVVDKFGTGDHLLAYVGDVVKVPAGHEPTTEHRAHHRGQLQVGSDDFDAVLGADRGDRLAVVKLGATWCPPCRLVDSAIERLTASNETPDVDYFEADLDAHPALAERFEVHSLPTLQFYYRGRLLAVDSASLHCVGGALLGGVSQGTLRELTAQILSQARLGHSSIQLP